MNKYRIEVSDLTKIYYQSIPETLRTKKIDRNKLSNQNKIVLNGLSFVLQAGDTIGIIGKNGAGKSTLLSILAGITDPTEGEINIQGKVTAVMTLGIGLREDLTGRENIYLDGVIQGKSKEEIDLVIEEIIHFSELGDFIDKPIKTYSTGMKSRLAFSMLVVIEPEILIIDEALSAGDVFFANKATKKIKEICKKGKIVIIVSHSMTAIESMCNRCMWIDNGSILMDGCPKEVTKAYLKQVQEEDQKTEVERYNTANQIYTTQGSNFKILSTISRLSSHNYPQSVFYVDDFIVFDILLVANHLTDCVLHLIIERLDGLKICHSIYHIDIQKIKLGIPFKIECSLESLVLNKGMYSFEITTLEQNIITNRFDSCIEVKNCHTHSGGIPVLHYPANIIPNNKEIMTCSDSQNMITE